MDNITPILRHQPGEVMVNFMYDFINRFVNYPDSANEASLDRCFGTTEWRGIRDATDREAASVECYKEQLRVLFLPVVVCDRFHCIDGLMRRWYSTSAVRADYRAMHLCSGRVAR